MAKYRVDTTDGSYIVETEDPPDGGAPPDAGAQMRASALAGVKNQMLGQQTVRAPSPDGSGTTTLTLPSHPNEAPGQISPKTQIVHGAERAAEPGIRAKVGGVDQMGRGATRIMAEGVAPVLAVAAPLATAADVALGTGASNIVEGGLKKLGVPDEYAESAGDLAGLGVPSSAHTKVGGRMLDAVNAAVDRVTPSTPTALLPRSGSPVEKAAVDWALAHGAPLDAAAATQNPVIRGTQEIAGSIPGAGAPIRRAIQARNDWFAQKGRDLAAGNVDQGGGAPVTPTNPQTAEAAGRAVFDQGVAAIKGANTKAGQEYAALQEIENKPESLKPVPAGTQTKTVPMQVGTREVPVPGVVDASGKPATRTEPVMQDVSRDVLKTQNVALPVDMGEYQARFKPVLEQLQRQTRLGQQQYAPAQMAVEDLVNGPRFVPASVAEKNLGALKDVLRKNTLTGGVTNDAGALASTSIDQLQSDIDKAVREGGGPEALTALKAGRENTAKKYQAIDLVDQFKAEPVKLYNQMVAPHDGNIDFLRNVQKLAPEQMPEVGRAWIDGAMDKATEAGKFDHADRLYADWQNLGDASKRILFKTPEHIADLDKFFQAAKDASKVENSSGTAKVGHLSATGTMILLHPILGSGYAIGGNLLARLLYNPRFVRAAIGAMDTPVRSSRSAGVARALVSAAGTNATPIPVQTRAQNATPGAENVPTSEGVTNGPETETANPGGTPQGVRVHAEVQPNAENQGRGNGTTVSVPGQPGPGFKAQYAVRELNEVNASHSGHTFEPNGSYPLKNQRNYGNANNQGKIVTAAAPGEFQHAELINTAPNATSGPPVVDSDGTVLGGNGRTMILQRVYRSNPKGAAAYRQALADQAGTYGIDPAQIAKMKEPVLVRVIDDAEFTKAGRSKEGAIADFNKTGTAALTPAERAIADSQRVSNDTLDHVAGQLEAEGPKATVSSILEGKGGAEILDKLIKDGVVSPQERAGLANENGLTKDGKERVSKLLLGRFFDSPEQMDSFPGNPRAKVERLAAPIAATEGLGEWNLVPKLREAVGIVSAAKQAGVASISDFLKQEDLFAAAGTKYSPEAVTLAKALSVSRSADVVAAARQFAEDAKYAGKGDNLLGNAPEFQDSFNESFGKLKSGAQVEAEARRPK